MGYFNTYKDPESPSTVLYITFEYIYGSRLPSYTGYKKCLLNFIGWPHFEPGVLNIIIAILRVLFIPFTLTLNILKLITEFLPRLITELLANHREHLRRKVHYAEMLGNTKFKVLAYKLGILLLHGLQLIGEGIYFIGKAITSPISGMQRAWYLTMNLYSDPYKPSSKTESALRIILASLLALTSLAITVVSYTFLLPLLVTGLPALFGTNVAAHIGSALALPVITPMAHFFSTLIPGLSSATTALAAIGTLSASAFTVLGIICSKIVDYIKPKRHYDMVYIPLENELGGFRKIDTTDGYESLNEPEPTSPNNNTVEFNTNRTDRLFDNNKYTSNQPNVTHQKHEYSGYKKV